MANGLILVVDDDADVREIFRAFLEASGFDVIVASDGQEGVDAARAHGPDLILMDLQMPGLGGPGAVARLKGDAAWTPRPVVAMTSMRPGEEEIREAGFCALLTKPIGFRELTEAVTRCIQGYAEGRRWIRLADSR